VPLTFHDEGWYNDGEGTDEPENPPDENQVATEEPPNEEPQTEWQPWEPTPYEPEIAAPPVESYPLPAAPEIFVPDAIETPPAVESWPIWEPDIVAPPVFTEPTPTAPEIFQSVAPQPIIETPPAVEVWPIWEPEIVVLPVLTDPLSSTPDISEPVPDAPQPIIESDPWQQTTADIFQPVFTDSAPAKVEPSDAMSLTFHDGGYYDDGPNDDGDQADPFSPAVIEQEPDNQSPPESAPYIPPSNPAPLPIMQGDPSHKYVGSDSRGDVYQLVDAGGNVIEWAVAPGDDSRNVLPGTIQNIGAPSSMTIAQNYVPPASGVAVSSGPRIGDASHKYVGSDSRGDVYQLVDAGGNVIEWAVAPGDDSRNVIGSTLRNLGAPSSATVAQTYIPPAQTPVPGGGKTVTQVIANGGTTLPPLTATTPARTNGVPGSIPQNQSSIPLSGGNPRQGDSRHKYVGRDSRGDVWQIFDGANVIEWAVLPGDDSRNALPGTARNLGAPSTATIAQNDGYSANAPLSVIASNNGLPAANAPASAGSLAVILSLAGIAVEMLK
jgi:hypothetical protein